MADNTAIEWTDATWNPVTGCSVVSPGCTNCYAMKLAGTRLRNEPSRKGLTRNTKAGPVWNGEVRLNERWLTQPLSWKRPRRIFVCAHGDLFAENVPDVWIDRVFAVMALSPQHTFQVLTKRAARMREYLTDLGVVRRLYELVCELTVEKSLPVVLMARGIPDPGLMPAWPRVHLARWPLPNIWLGVSAEDQVRADARVPDLLATPAAVRFVSAEPLLGPIDLNPFLFIVTKGDDAILACRARHEEPLPFHDPATTPADEIATPRVDWIIVGGESGPSVRAMHPAWARSIRDQCAGAGVAFFFKQWGAFRPLTQAEHGQACGATLIGTDPYDRDAYVLNVPKKAAGRLLDGVEHSAFPESRA